MSSKRFTITFHYNGRIEYIPRVSYFGGKVSVVKDVEPIGLTKLELSVLTAYLGVCNAAWFGYVKPGKTLSTGYKTILMDDDILEMIEMLPEDRMIHIYVEHNPNREIIDFTVPIAEIRPMYLEWYPEKVDLKSIGVKKGVEMEDENLLGVERGAEMDDGNLVGVDKDVPKEVSDKEGDLAPVGVVGKDKEEKDSMAEKEMEKNVEGIDKNHSESEIEDLFEYCDKEWDGDKSEDEMDGNDQELEGHDDNVKEVEGTNDNCEVPEVQSGNVEGELEDEYEESNIDCSIEEESDSSDEGSIEANEPFDAHVSIDGEVGSDYRSSSNLKSPINSNGRRMTRDPEFREDTDMEKIEFVVGMLFSTSKVLKEAIKEYATKRGYNIRLIKNDKRRVTAICVGECTWRLYASASQGDDTFQIKTYKSEHSCCREFNKKLNSAWIARKYLSRFRQQPDWRLVDIIETVKSECNCQLSKSQAYRARKKALRQINGTMITQYQRLWDYCAELRRSNEGSSVKILCDRVHEDSKPVFRRLYICFKGCKDGFLAGCRPFISLDACHLKGPCQGHLMSAVGTDGNDDIYPIAWAIVEAETKNSWTWFLRLLESDIGSFAVKGYTFMSDQQNGLVPTFNDVFPGVDHRFCVKHFYANFQKQFKGLALKNCLWKAAQATMESEFDEAMEELRKLDVNAYQYVKNIPSKFWSKHSFQTSCKSDLLFNNNSESFNAFINEARDKPIVQMLEIIRKLVMTRITKKFQIYSRLEGNLGPKIQSKLENIKKHSGNLLFEVEVGVAQYIVDLEKRTCSCRKWDLNGIPCVHAIQSIYFSKQKPEDYVNQFYHKDTLIKTYSSFLKPVNGSSLWPKTTADLLQPPKLKQPLGQPRRQRKRDASEAGSSQPVRRQASTVRCSKCKNVGHNARSCKGEVTGQKQKRRRTTFMGFNTPSTEEDALEVEFLWCQPGSSTQASTNPSGRSYYLTRSYDATFNSVSDGEK